MLMTALFEPARFARVTAHSTPAIISALEFVVIVDSFIADDEEFLSTFAATRVMSLLLAGVVYVMA
jgi:hypothetical protein